MDLRTKNEINTTCLKVEEAQLSDISSQIYIMYGFIIGSKLLRCGIGPKTKDVGD